MLPNSFKSALIPRFAGIPVRTGYVGELRQMLLNDARPLDEQALPLMVERFAHLADAPGESLARPLPPLSLQTSRSQQRAPRSRSLGLALDAPVACLCPGAEYGPAKRWPAAHFAALARKLDADGLPGLAHRLVQGPRHRRGDRTAAAGAAAICAAHRPRPGRRPAGSCAGWWCPTTPD